MDFGGFICFGLGIVLLIVLATTSLWAFGSRQPYRAPLLVVTGALIVLLVFAGLHLYQVFALDEGIIEAAAAGNARETKAFLSRGASPNATWEDGTTALQLARKSKNPETIDALIQAGAR